MKVVLVRTYEDVDIDFCKKSSFTGVVIDKMYITFYKNSKIHNPYCAASIILFDFRKEWWFNNKCCGKRDDFTNKTWKKKVKELKREEELKIFI